MSAITVTLPTGTFTKYCRVRRAKFASAVTFDSDNDADTKIDVTHHMTSSNVTHSDVAFVAFGDFGRRVIDASIFISHIGFCCAYLIFISENLSAIFPSIDKQEFLAMILPVMFLLSLVPDLNKLAVFSFFAQVKWTVQFSQFMTTICHFIVKKYCTLASLP